MGQNISTDPYVSKLICSADENQMTIFNSERLDVWQQDCSVLCACNRNFNGCRGRRSYRPFDPS